jgi:hypothetical protein
MSIFGHQRLRNSCMLSAEGQTNSGCAEHSDCRQGQEQNSVAPILHLLPSSALAALQEKEIVFRDEFDRSLSFSR